jgi:site-specific recombinase XerC
LLDSIDVTTPAGLRDRALIGLMVYSFARIGAALSMKVEYMYVQNRRQWVRLHENGGKRHEMPCHHNLETYLHAHIDGCGLEKRSEGAAVPDHRPAHPPAHGDAAPPSQRLRHYPQARGRGRHTDFAPFASSSDLCIVCPERN